MLRPHGPIERRPIHLGHAEIRQDQIVDMGAKAFERLWPGCDCVYLAEPAPPYRTDNQSTQERVVVDHEDARPFEAGRVHVPVRAAVTRFAVGERLTADRAEDMALTRHR